MENKHRALLIEFVNGDQFPGRVNYVYPFLRGFLDEGGVPTRWIRFGISTTNLMEHQRDQITLTEGELARLLEVIQEHQPNLIMMTDPLFGPQAQSLMAQAPEARIQDVSHSVPKIDGLRTFSGPLELDRPDFKPRYDWEPGNEAANRKEIDNVYLAQVRRCGHQKRVADNHCYQGISDGRVEERLGCTFCTNWIGSAKVSRRTPTDWIVKQLRGIAESRATPDRFPNGVMLESLESPSMLDECIQTMQATGLADHVQLLLAIRSDKISTFEQVIDEHFRNQPDSGMKFGVYACGIESFSQSELLLFNKGTTPLDGLRTINTLRELEDRYPGRFWYTGVTFLLFTPWTTLEAMHLNLGLINFLGFMGKEGGNVFQSRLRLHPDLAITSLAERDGLLVDQEPDRIVVMNRRKLFSQERPWRFADARLRPLSRIVLRLDLLAKESQDAISLKIKHILFESGLGFREQDLVDFLLHMVDVLRREAGVLDEAQLLDRAMDLWISDRDKTPAEAGSRRHRIGAKRLDLAGLLTHLVPLVQRGLKPLLSVMGVQASDLEPAASALLESKALPWTLADGSLFIAASQDVLIRRTALQESLNHQNDLGQHRSDLFDTGRLYGVPECCARAYATGPFSDGRHARWAAFSKRCEKAGLIPAELNPMLVPSLAFIPCTADCPEAARVYRKWFDALPVVGLPGENKSMAYVFAIEGQGDSAFIPLQVIGSDEQSMRYSLPEDSSQADEPLGQKLAAGNLLRFVPGQIRVYRNDRLLDLMTASHGVWYSGRCWHPEVWRELARAARYLARQQPEPDWTTRSQPANSDDGEQNRQSKLCFLLEKTIERYPGRFGDISLVQLKVFRKQTSIRAHVTIGSHEYELVLQNRSSAEAHAFQTIHFSVSYKAETPPRSPEDNRKIESLADFFDQAVSHYAPDCLP